MKKKFYGALLLGSLFLAGGMVSCSDYDDDINSLTQRVDAIEKSGVSRNLVGIRI